MRTWSVIAAVLMTASCAAPQTADEAQLAVTRAVDCSALGARVNFEAVGSARPGHISAPIDPPLLVKLSNVGAVSAALVPGRTEKSTRSFAGLVPFRVQASGTYTVLVASLAWADVGEANPPRAVEPQSFKWVAVCGTKFKSGRYALDAGKTYIVQLWDSPDRELMLMIRRLP